MTRSDQEQAARRLLHIKEIAERIVEDLGGDPDLILRDRIHAGNAERQLEKIGEAAKALPEEVRRRQPEIQWGGWGRYRDHAVHAYDKVVPSRVSNDMRVAVPLIVAAAAEELPGALERVNLYLAPEEREWKLARVGERPKTEEALDSWWTAQRDRFGPSPETGRGAPPDPRLRRGLYERASDRRDLGGIDERGLEGPQRGSRA